MPSCADAARPVGAAAAPVQRRYLHHARSSVPTHAAAQLQHMCDTLELMPFFCHQELMERCAAHCGGQTLPSHPLLWLAAGYVAASGVGRTKQGRVLQ